MRIRRTLLFLLIAAAGVIGADRLLFDYALFAIDNPSGWDSFRWVNFEYQFRRAEKRARLDRRPLVLFVGSSVAQYSYSKDRLEELLGPEFRVDLISHAAMIPTDLQHYRERILAMHPAVIVWPVNAVDFDLERLTPPWEAGPLRARRTEENFLSRRVPARMYYPAGAARFADGFQNRTSLWMRAALFSLRYPRDEWLPFAQFSMGWEPNSALRSYLNYQGLPVEGGLFREGYTGRCFAFPASYAGERLQMEVPAELFAAGLSWTIGEHSGGPCPRNGIQVKASKAGWNWVDLPHGMERYAISLSHVMSGGQAVSAQGLPNHAGRGVRLPGNLGRREKPMDDVYVRRPALEEEHLRALSETELIADYQKRLQPEGWEKRVELSSLNRLRLAKTLTVWSGFVLNRQLADLREFVKKTSEEVPVVLINQAEHPLALDDYEFGEWYSGYRSFLTDMHGGRVTVLDVHNQFAMNELGDPHHLTMDGARRLQPMIFEVLKPILGRE